MFDYKISREQEPIKSHISFFYKLLAQAVTSILPWDLPDCPEDDDTLN